jgi:hypothetical protein
MKAVDTACFAPTTLTDAQRIACLKPSGPTTTRFSARKLGLYAAFARAPQFASLFASPTDHATLVSQAGMPRNGTPFSSSELALVKGWVLRGMPRLDDAANPATDGGAPDGDASSESCVDDLSADLKTHVGKMKTDGWAARHADLGTPMQSLTTFSTLSSIGAPGVAQTIKKLRDITFDTHYWVRSSADGRWVGLGLETSSRVLDLSKPSTASPIVVAADYDPWFLPSNDGFSFAGAHADNAIHVCRQSLLGDVSAQQSPAISLTEAKCSTIATQVYQSIGTALDSVRYFVSFGAHENDDGGNDVLRPLPAAFGANASTTFVPMVNDGTAYRAESPTTLALPGEGDLMLSPSTLAAATRTKDGYRLRLVKATRVGTSTTVAAPLAGTVCLRNGAKAAFSFDERFLATHVYNDVGALGANIAVVDLTTGKKVVVTKMPAGQFALYPHFRADGWLYFLVRDRNTGSEHLAATDVAVQMAALP